MVESCCAPGCHHKATGYQKKNEGVADRKVKMPHDPPGRPESSTSPPPPHPPTATVAQYPTSLWRVFRRVSWSLIPSELGHCEVGQPKPTCACQLASVVETVASVAGVPDLLPACTCISSCPFHQFTWTECWLMNANLITALLCKSHDIRSSLTATFSMLGLSENRRTQFWGCMIDW